MIPSPATLADRPASKTPSLPLSQRLGFGAGGAAETVGQLSLPTLAQPIFGITFGMSPFLVGLILTIFRLWDAVIDPWMGSISDNAKTRWGRRRPFIVIGALGGALAYAAIFFAPRGWGEMAYFVYFLGFSLVFYTFFTCYTIPYQALGLSLTTDPTQRMSLVSYRGVFYQVAGIAVGWMYAAAQLDFFANTVQGIRVVGVLTAIAFCALALLPALLLRERDIPPPNRIKVPFWPSFKSAMRNRDFLLIIAICLLVVTSSQMVTHLGLYLKIFYVFDGDTKMGATVAGIAFTAYQVSAILTVPVLSSLSKRIGKRRALFVCFAIMLTGTVVKWFAYAPGAAFLIPVAAALIAPGNSAVLTVLFSMVGDVVDADAHAGGERRDGMFVSVFGWITKMGSSTAGMVSGGILVIAGFQQSLGAAQDPETFQWMRALFVAVPFVGVSVAAVLVGALGLRIWRQALPS